MIAVRIPDEIKKYKEKLLFGLTARQLIATAITLLVCVPLYMFGKDYMSEDTLSWIIILIAMPLMSIGFLKVNNLPMEKFFVEWFKFEVLYPQKRKYKSENQFRTWQNMAYKEDALTGKKKKKEMKLNMERSLEKSYLMLEAETQGLDDFDVDAIDLLTVPSTGNNGKKPKKNKQQKIKEKKKTKKELRAIELMEKRKNDPTYVPTKKDYKLEKWYRNLLQQRRKQMIAAGKEQTKKKNTDMKKRRKVKTTIPDTVQKTIPIIADYEEGMIEVQPNKYSKMYRIKDINYRVGKEEEQVTIFVKLGEFLNYFSEEMNFAFIIDNRVISTQEQERKVFYKLTGDQYDGHRREFNNILRRQIIAGRNDIQVEKFITVTIDAPTPIEALLRFHKIDNEIINNLRKIGSDGKVLSTTERLEYYHDKFRVGHEGEFHIDYDFIKTQGISSKDYIAPSMMQFKNDYFMIDDTYCRCMFLDNLPASLSDEFLSNLTDNDFPVTTSLSIQPVAQDKGLRIVKKQLTGIEANKIEAEKRAIRAGYDPDTIQHQIKDALKQAEMLYDDMLNKNQKMFFVSITVMVSAESKEKLDEQCKELESKARTVTSQLKKLAIQQEEAMKMTLPFGFIPEKVSVERTLTTESTSIFMPFANQELFQAGGFYYGLNQMSHNLVVCNRTAMKTPSGFVLGSSGSGKSFATKREILNVLLNDSDTVVLVIDPENEYGDFCRCFGGTVVKLSNNTDNFINPFDMPEDYGLDEEDDDDLPMDIKKDKALQKKSEYIMSIVERMISKGGNGDSTAILPQQKTIIDRCVRRVYEAYLAHDFDEAYLPTFVDFQNELDKERDTQYGMDVAEGVAYYTKGSMNVFAHKTNVNLSNRFMVFNVRDLNEQLRQIAQIIMFDFIWNRMIDNRYKNVRTYCYCDEIHTMFHSYYSADYLKQFYKRGRKYGMCITGLTQNIEDLLRSEQARGMINNSDFIMMLNQKSEDLKVLAEILSISDAQKAFVQNVDAGCGLLFAESVIVPFVDRFPEDSYLYQLMSTKFGENASKEEVNKKIRSIMSQGELKMPKTEEEIEEQVYKNRVS